jgi:spore germination protein GerM
VTLLMATGCGVPTDDRPRALSAEDVPAGLLAAAPLSTTTTLPPTSSSEVLIYLVGRDRLVPVTRTVESPATVERLVRVLVNGPTDDELAAGLRSALSPAVLVVSAPVEAGIATIDLSAPFAVAPQPEQILALAQIVYTATGLSGVGGVRFTLAGIKATVPQGDGTSTAAPVGRATYASVAPSL